MLTDTQHQQLRSWLEAERDRLKTVLGHLEDEAVSLGESEEAERGTLGNHPADSGTDAFEAEQVIALERNEEELLDLVERALERMDAGTYGVCERCGREIAAERLEALPYATLCIACQAELEREQQ
jgi:RNA polymerase-binding protein DksA